MLVVITRHDSSPSQESICANIVRRACDSYSKLGLPALHVSVHFNYGHTLLKADMMPIAEKIVNIVSTNVPSAGNSLGKNTIGLIETTFLRKYMLSVLGTAPL